MRRLWRHIEYNYRQGGLPRVLYKGIWRFRQWLWSESDWLIYRCEVAGYQGESSMALVRKELECESLLRHEYYKIEAFPEMVRARFDGGSRCHGFFVGDQLTNIAWTSRGVLEMEPGLSVAEGNCVGIYDCYTMPAYRSRGIYKESLIQLIRLVREEGARVVLIAVHPQNYPSIKGIERAGFIPLYKLTHRRRVGRASVQRYEFVPYSR